jgi:tRNA pseudouridine55 synthase
MTADKGAPPADATPEAGSAPAWFQILADGDAVRLLPASAPAPKPPAPPQKPAPPKSGILVLDKPAGMTSFGVVHTIRRAADVQRVGHAGTLDPAATGVLVVCLGAATRVIGEIQEQPKRYRAEIHFGVSTDTYDAEGTVTHEADASHLTRDDIDVALTQFRGDIQQRPPMYSAVHHEGQRLYRLARRGQEVERAERTVRVHELSVVSYNAAEAPTSRAPRPVLVVDLLVSKGTYIRSIAHDLGELLGTGAHLASLRRTSVGSFTESSAVPLAEAVDAFSEGWWPNLLFTLDHALQDLPAVVADVGTAADMRHGRQFAGPAPEQAGRALLRVYTTDGILVGVAAWDHESGLWQPQRVFLPG